MKERLGTGGRILNTSPIVIERVKSGGRVIVAVIEGERSIPIAGVLVATRIAEECVKPGGHVSVASGIVKKRLGTVGRARTAGSVAEERFIAGRGVLVTSVVAMECFKTNGHIPDSASEAKECVSPLRRVLASIASVRWGVDRSRYGRKT